MPIPQKNNSFSRKNAKERVLQTLYDWIINGTLEPGERIYDEELSKYFSVSRTPVREALQVLAEKQLVEILPARCTRVTLINLQDLGKIYALISALHGLAVRMAFKHIGAAEIKQLEKINGKLAALPDEQEYLADMRELDRQFHMIILNLTDNRYLISDISELSLHIDRAETLYFRHRNDLCISVQGHALIIDALKKRNLSLAIQATEENWMLAFNAISPHL